MVRCCRHARLGARPVPLRRLAGLAAHAGRGRPRRARDLGRRVGRDRRVGRVVRPRRRPAVHDRHRTTRRTTGCWARDPRRLRRRPRVGAADGRVARTGGSASSTSSTGRGCSRSRPGSSTCTCRRCRPSTPGSTYAGTGRRSCVHDPDGLIELRHDDAAEMRGRPSTPPSSRSASDAGTGEWLVNRALARGHDAEAVDLYLRFALGPVVRMLRVEHCPWRHDYGLRYLGEDLPGRRGRLGVEPRWCREPSGGRPARAVGGLLRVAGRAASSTLPAGTAAVRCERVPARSEQRLNRNHTAEPDQDPRQVGDHGDRDQDPEQHQQRQREPWRRRRAAATRCGACARRGGTRGRGETPARQVGEDRAQLGAGLRRPDPVEPLAVLLGGEPALGVVLAEVGGRLLALGVARSAGARPSSG